jgi:hypothetical protein
MAKCVEGRRNFLVCGHHRGDYGAVPMTLGNELGVWSDRGATT